VIEDRPLRIHRFGARDSQTDRSEDTQKLRLLFACGLGSVHENREASFQGCPPNHVAILAVWMAGLKEKRKFRWPAKPLGRVIHLAHLSQVDCQYGSGPKPFQNNNLQFDDGLFRSTWLTLRTHTGEQNCRKMCELLSPERYAVWQDDDGRWMRTYVICSGPLASFGVFLRVLESVVAAGMLLVLIA
jgi:hypothetical protein